MKSRIEDWGELADNTPPQQPKGESTRRLRYVVVATIAYGVFLAFVCYVPLFGRDIACYLSKFDAFKRIALTMPRQQVELVLAEFETNCKSSVVPASCQFSDFWRTYSVTFDPLTNRVVTLEFYFKKRPSLLERLRKPR